MIWHALHRLIVAVEGLLEQPVAALVEMEISYSVAAMNRIAKSLTCDMPYTEIVVQRYKDDISRLSLLSSASVCP
jgi:hypothetical protein